MQKSSLSFDREFFMAQNPFYHQKEKRLLRHHPFLTPDTKAKKKPPQTERFHKIQIR